MLHIIRMIGTSFFSGGAARFTCVAHILLLSNGNECIYSLCSWYWMEISMCSCEHPETKLISKITFKFIECGTVKCRKSLMEAEAAMPQKRTCSSLQPHTTIAPANRNVLIYCGNRDFPLHQVHTAQWTL